MLALFICGASILQNMPVKANAETTSDFPCAYSAGPADTQYMRYGSSEVITYTAEQAAEVDVPEGYSGNVLKVVPLSGGTSCGVLLDFSAKEIPVSLVESLEFCFYVGSHATNTNAYPQLRIAMPNKMNDWVYQPGSTASKTDTWTTETVQNTNSLFDKLADENGNLNKFELSIRSKAQIPFYIDGIALNMVQNDGVAPVITYNGADAISVAQGAALNLDVTAYDAQEKCEKTIEYIWAEGVSLDEKGVPTSAGEYALTLKATDYFGNVSEKTLAVTVVEPDVKAPVICLTFTEMYVQVGTIPVLNVTVTDEVALAETSCVWSEGALDDYGKLTEGTHTYTVTATDTSGNQAVKTLTVHVTVDEPTYENIIDEEALTPRYFVTFGEEQEGEWYRYGEKLKKPVDPVKAKTEEYTYTFLGWYNGDVAWDFENDVVTETLNLTAKWLETPVLDSPSPAPSTGDNDSKKEGCSGSIGLTMTFPIMLGACALMLKGKKKA